MDRISVLVVILSLQISWCLGLGDSSPEPQYDLYSVPDITTTPRTTPWTTPWTPTIPGYLPPSPPPTCEARKEITFNFTKILVTQTSRLPPVTDVITLPPEMAYISMPPVMATLTIFTTQRQPPITVDEDVPPGECQPIQPISTSLTTLELATTVTVDPIIEVKPWKEIEWETVPPVTDTVTITSTEMLPDTNMHMVLRHFTNTIVLPTVTNMTTISVTTTEMLPAIIKTKRLGKTKTERASPVTERHAPVTMMQPPQVKIYRIDITQTHIPPAVSKMVMYTTTKYEELPCDDYKNKIPTKAFTHGRGATQAFNFGLPNLS